MAICDIVGVIWGTIRTIWKTVGAIWRNFVAIWGTIGQSERQLGKILPKLWQFAILSGSRKLP